MSGRLLESARKIAQRHVTKGGFEENITISTPPNATVPNSIQTTGLASKHWINYDENGAPINSKNAHICISETDLTEKGFYVRNKNEEVNMLRYIVSVKDSSGGTKEYEVIEQHPNETMGLIVLILGDYNSGDGLQMGLQVSL